MRTFTAILIVSVVLGGLAFLIFHQKAPIAPPALSEVERVAMDAKEALAVAEQASREALAVRQSLAKEVRARAETIHKEVADYDAARIARELNIFCYGDR